MKLSTTACDVCGREETDPHMLGAMSLKWGFTGDDMIFGEVCVQCRAAIRDAANHVYYARSKSPRLVVEVEE